MKISRKSIGSLRPGDETGSVPGRHRSLRTAPSGYPLEATWRIEPSSARPDKSLRTRRDPRELHDHLTLQSPRWLNSGRENGSTSGRDQQERRRMTQEGRSGKSQGSDEFQQARHLAASLALAPPRQLTSELQRITRITRGHAVQEEARRVKGEPMEWSRLHDAVAVACAGTAPRDRRAVSGRFFGRSLLGQVATLLLWDPGCIANSGSDCLPGGRQPPQEAFRAQVLVNVRPVDAIAAASDHPICPLLRRGVKQTRIPSQRHRDRSAVEEPHFNSSSVTSTSTTFSPGLMTSSPPHPCAPARPRAASPRSHCVVARWPGVLAA